MTHLSPRISRMKRGFRQPPSGVTRKGVSHYGDAPHSRGGGNSNSSSDDRTFNCNIKLDNGMNNTSFGDVQRPRDGGGDGREGKMRNIEITSCGDCSKHSHNRRNKNRIRRGLLKSIQLVTANRKIPPASKEAILEGYRAQLELFQRCSQDISGAVRVHAATVVAHTLGRGKHSVRKHNGNDSRRTGTARSV